MHMVDTAFDPVAAALKQMHEAVTNEDVPDDFMRILAEIDAKIEAYLKQLDRQDVVEATVRTPTVDELHEKLRHWQDRQQTYQGYVEQLTQSGETQLSLTDPDTRKMPTAGHGPSRRGPGFRPAAPQTG